MPAITGENDDSGMVMMPARSNRTFISTVLFLDIAEYTKKPVAEQIQLKERFNVMLAEALDAVSPNDRIILDTGDGAAISFLGDPEEVLFAGLALREAVNAHQPADAPELKMRIGVNLGPVRLVKDLNGQPNIIGDGINVAQRIMSFAEPGQILVSRSYYEVVSCLSEEYAKLFHYEGSRTDKHVRAHEVYAVGAAIPAVRRPYRNGNPETASAPAIDHLSQTATSVTDSLRRKPWLGTALAVVAILAGALIIRNHRSPPPEISAVEAAPKIADAKSEPPAAAGVPPVAKASAIPAAGEQVLVRLAISPWGEIYVDGKKYGVSPPLREVGVGLGRHRIEVRNTTFPPYVETVDVTADSRINIRYKFH